MLKVHKVALDLNNTQTAHMIRACGVARFVYNWALAEWERQYASGGKPNICSISKQFNSIKRVEFPWCCEVAKNAAQQAIINLGIAYKRAFSNVQNKRIVGKKKNPYGFPRFKKKGIHDSFKADDGRWLKPIDGKLNLPIIGWIKLCEDVRFDGWIKSVVISRKANRWFASLTIEIKDQQIVYENQGMIGVDLGVKTMAVCSNGMKFEAPKPLKKKLKLLQRAQRVLSRRKKNSANRKKARLRVEKLHAKISNIRLDALHKATTTICKSASIIVLEDLSIKGMLSNKRLSRAISDIGLYEFRRQCTYKAPQLGGEVRLVPRFYPSSKLCSCCGAINRRLKLNERQWLCRSCNTVHDRDENAATNLEQYYTVRSTGIHACGEN